MTKSDTKVLVKSLGGPIALASAINELATNPKERITPQAISLWLRIPQARCLQIEKITHGAKRCHELRPDVFPAPKCDAAA